MKIRYFIFLFSFFALNFKAFTQVESGNWLINGHGNFGLINENRVLAYTSQIRPKLGYFILDFAVVGSEISYRYDRVFDSRKITTLGFSPFARFYFYDKKWMPYFEVNFDYKRRNVSIDVVPGSLKSSTDNLFFRLGLNYALSKNVSINSSVNVRLKKENFEPNTEYLFELGREDRALSFTIGLDYFLIGKKNRKEVFTQKPLIERYLKKGNQSIGFSGFGQLKDIFIIGSINWNRFLSEKFRLNTATEIAFVDILALRTIIAWRPQIDPFLRIKKNTFFVPNVGMDLITSFTKLRNFYFWSGNIHPKLIQFFHNGILELGFYYRLPFYDMREDEEIADKEGLFTISLEFFLQENLSIRGEYRAGIIGEDFMDGVLFFNGSLPSDRFRFGINYFFNNTQKIKASDKN